MELQFDDLEYDEAQQYNLKIAQLKNQLQQITSRLSFPPYVQTSLAGYKIAEHYMGKGIPAVVGGLAGFYFFRNRKISDMDREIMLKKVNVIRKQIGELQRQRDAGVSAAQGIMSADQLSNYAYEKYDFDGKWEKFFGNPSINCHYMVFGLPKSGKSTFCMHFAKYLADNFGSVLYVAAEEGFSSTLQNKVNTFNLNSKNVAFSNFREYEPIREIAGQFDFLFIDSVNFIKISPDEIEQIKKENPDLSIITIQQATKDGSYKGDTAYAHNCDSIVKIIDGFAFQQGRFHESSEMQVFPKGKQSKLIGYDGEEVDESNELGLDLGQDDYDED